MTEEDESASAAKSLVGTKVGSYEILDQLGSGGMATIFRASGPAGPNVALKAIKSDLMDKPEFVKRFTRENQIYKQLRHPNIVRVLDGGRDSQSNIYYLVMELIPGKPLEDMLKPGVPQDIGWSVEIACQILEGLDHAHAKGIVHRDMKPGNVILKPDGTPVIVDFGIAYLSNATNITQTGKFIGTPAYIAPEMTGGGDRALGPTTDLYSVGVILYEMVTGRLPFVSTSPMGVIFKHMHEKPPPPKQFNAAIGRHLQAVILRALEKDQLGRPQSGREMSLALRSAMAEDAKSTGSAPKPATTGASAVKSTLRATGTGSVAAVPGAETKVMSTTLEQALTLEHPLITQAIGLFHSGEHDKADLVLNALTTTAKEDEISAQAQYLRGLMAWNVRRYNTAIELLRDLQYKWAGSSLVLPGRLIVGRCLCEESRFVDAIKEFRAVLSEGPRDGQESEAIAGLEGAMQRAYQAIEAKQGAGQPEEGLELIAQLRKVWESDQGQPFYRTLHLEELRMREERVRAAIAHRELVRTASMEKERSHRVQRRGLIVAAVLLAVAPVIYVKFVDPSLWEGLRLKWSLSRGDQAGAIAALRAYLALRPDDAGKWLDLARLEATHGSPEKSLEAYGKTLAATPAADDVMREAISIAGSRRTTDEMLSSLEALHRAAPGSEAAVLSLARLEGDMGRHEAALKRLEGPAARPGASYELRRERALLFARAKPASALPALEALLQEKPGDAKVLGGLARVHVGMDNRDLALQALDRATQIEAPPVEEMAALAELYEKCGRRDQALELRQARCGMTRCTAADWLGIARGWRELDELDRANQALHHATEVDPGHAESLELLGDVYVEKGLPEQAAGFYKKRLVVGADTDAAIQLKLVRALLEAGSVIEADGMVQLLAARKPPPAGLDLLRADLDAAQGRLDGAIEAYERALAAEPSRAEIALRAGKLLARHDRHLAAVDWFLKALAVREGDIEAWNELGTARLKAGQAAMAVEAFRRAVELNPQSATSHLNLGLVLHRTGDGLQARNHLQEALRLAPRHPQGADIRKLLSTLAR